MTPGVFLALGLVLATFAPAPVSVHPAQTRILRVYVKTDDTGEKSELAARRQSVADMTAELAAKKKSFSVAETEDAADLVVEVIGRAVYVPKVVMGLSPRPGDPSSIPGMVSPVRSPVLKIRVTRGTLATSFTNKNKPPESLRGWQEAANDLAGQIEKWVKTTSRD
jgi:hypothetical protein